MKHLLLIGIGGFLGSVARYVIGNPFNTPAFPYGTFMVNAFGCFLIGLVIGLDQRFGLGAPWKLFLATGICGGFTTFSAFSVETLTLLQEQKIALALFYSGGSVLLGLCSCYCAMLLVKAV